MAKQSSLYPTSLDTEFATDRASGDTITSSAYDILENAVSALEVKVGVTNSSVTTSLDYLSRYGNFTGLSATTISGSKARFWDTIDQSASDFDSSGHGYVLETQATYSFPTCCDFTSKTGMVHELGLQNDTNNSDIELAMSYGYVYCLTNYSCAATYGYGVDMIKQSPCTVDNTFFGNSVLIANTVNPANFYRGSAYRATAEPLLSYTGVRQYAGFVTHGQYGWKYPFAAYDTDNATPLFFVDQYGSIYAKNVVQAAAVTGYSLSSTYVCASTITATNISATSFSGTNAYTTTVTATNISATSFSGTNAYATTITATNVSATTFSGTNTYATTVTATNITATGFSAGDGTTLLPSYSFTSGPTYGFMKDGQTIYGIANTALKFAFDTNGVYVNRLYLGNKALTTFVGLYNVAALSAMAIMNSDDTVACHLSAGNIWATTVTATNITATSFSGTNVYATTVTATNFISRDTYTNVTDTSVTMSANNGYILNNASVCSATLPGSAGIGSKIEIVGYGAGLWKLVQGANQVIHFGNLNTTTGATGYLSATNRYDSITLVCVVATNEYVVQGSVGNIVVV